MKVGRVARQNDDATGRIRLQRIAVELLAQAYVEHARHDRVDPVLRMSVGHHLDVGGYFDPDYVGSRLTGITDNDGETG